VRVKKGETSSETKPPLVGFAASLPPLDHPQKLLIKLTPLVLFFIMYAMKMIENCAALTIAGSDSGGGAGIQADLKTFSALGVFGTSVITAITAQNLSGVYAVQEVEPEVVQKQLHAVLKCFPVKAIKTGMLFSAEIIEVIAQVLSNYNEIPLVIDPVFAATSGSKLIRDDAILLLTEKLFPLAKLITPNLAEAEILLEEKLKNRHDLELAAQKFFEGFNVPVLMKGGHLTDMAVDIMVDEEGMESFESKLVSSVNNHGSGCTLASAIAAVLAKGESLRQAVKTAKTYITEALKNSLPLSPGLRIINHFFEM
jgi:hydroxymethylpyrimidine/phosphomethylpyrimidine kinase